MSMDKFPGKQSPSVRLTDEAIRKLEAQRARFRSLNAVKKANNKEGKQRRKKKRTD